jgi:hypothetical protein
MGEIKHATNEEILNGRATIPGYTKLHWNDWPDSCQKCEYGAGDYGDIMGCSHPDHPSYSGCDDFGLCPDYRENVRIAAYYAEQDT